MKLARRPVQSVGRAFLLFKNCCGGILQGAYRNLCVGFVVLGCLLQLTVPIWAQQEEHVQTSVHKEEVITDHQDHRSAGSQRGWEGSVAGIAYSEFNHHLTGILMLIIGLSELRQVLGVPSWAWTRFLLPGALLTSGVFLFVWSDHDAWPIGSLSFMQTFFGNDSEIFQHKSFALLSLTVGTIELLRRLGQIAHAVWVTPLPLFAIIGGLLLFGHSHGVHPSADKIAMGHIIMGTMAMAAGSSKLLSDWFRSPSYERSSKWELLWAALILLIGIQLLIYSE